MKKLLKYFNFVLLAVFLLAGCENLLMSSLDVQKEAKPGAGQGFLNLNIGGVEAGRTIIPPNVYSSDVAVCELVFTSPLRDTVTINRAYSQVSNNITLSSVTWDLSITAYRDYEKTIPIARGVLEGIVVPELGYVNKSLILKPITEDGTGFFRWEIYYPEQVKTASVTITPLNAETGSPERTLYFLGGTPLAENYNYASPLELNSGFYRVVFRVNNGAHTAAREEYLHVYANRTSSFSYSFTNAHFTIYIVTNGNDYEQGSLRYAIDYAENNSTIEIAESVGTINLTSNISIHKNITIKGNGVAIISNSSSYLIYIGGGYEVNISRVWFKDAKSISSDGAIYNSGGTVTLESCIFSNNKANDGGAIYSNSGTMSIKGSTFLNNSSSYGGAIYNNGTLMLTGNLFYGNTASQYYPVICPSGTRTSLGYNAVDVPFGTGNNQSGWDAHDTDIQINALPVSPKTFKLLKDGGAIGIIGKLPVGYPAYDFYGNPITDGASAGAVQGIVSGSGHFLDLTVNNSEAGIAALTSGGTPDADGLITSSSVTVSASANAGYSFSHWLVNGSNRTVNPLHLTLGGVDYVQAVFSA
jgi:predicted outer membrane repeat protein